MKKLIFTFFSLCQTAAIWALPVGNPSDASLFCNALVCKTSCDPCFSWWNALNIRVGYWGDFVFDRHLRVGDHDRPRTDGGALQYAESYTNAASFALNFCNRVDLFATIGETNFHTCQNTSVFVNGLPTIGGFESEFWFSTAFSWSVGARMTVWECKCLAFGIDGQYFDSRPNLDHFVLWGPSFLGAKIHFDDFKTHYKEWQFGFGASYQIATHCPNLAFVPYIAAKYSRVHWEFDNPILFPIADGPEFPTFRSQKNWGWSLGLSFLICKLAGITVEGRFADEKAIFVNGEVRF